MARPVETPPDADVLAQRLYLGRIERDLLHEFAKPFKNLSIAARFLIQQGAAAYRATLTPGQHAVTSENLQCAEVRVALDLRNAAHLRAFKQLTQTIDLLDRETKESLQ